MVAVELKGVVKKFGAAVALNNVSFSVEKGTIVSLLGPSGCGKTTTLRIIAGFEKPDAGSVSIDGKDMVTLRPYERNVGILFQEYALFPHMTVEENVMYGLRRRQVGKFGIAARAKEMLELVHLTGFEDRRPAQLSGGQQQRVALARALATSPAVMLLDEPLSALDAKLRLELRVELKEIIRSVGATTIVVTHDQEEAMSLGTRVIVMNYGQILQQGGPADIYNHPANRFVAEFVGRSNWFDGRLEEYVSAGVRRFVTDDNLALLVAASDTDADCDCGVCVRPERIRIESPTASNPGAELKHANRIPGRIVDSAHLGPDLHRFVLIASGRRIAVVEKYVGQFVGQLDEMVSLVFEPQDCLYVPRN